MLDGKNLEKNENENAYWTKFCINWPFFILRTKKKKGRNVTVMSLKTCGAI